MFFMVMATTLITTVFSALLPPFAWGCEYINNSFIDKFEFDCKSPCTQTTSEACRPT